MLSCSAYAQTPIRFALDWRFEGPSAPFFLALKKGYYKAEGLDVSIDAGNGSIDSLRKVAVGSHQIGFADMNALIQYRDDSQNPAIAGVMMLYDKPAYAIISLKKKKILKPADLEGRYLGMPPKDSEELTWPIFVSANGIDDRVIKLQPVSFTNREQMLVSGQVDAIAGFWFSSFMALKSMGIQGADIQALMLRDWGVELYGNALVASPEMIKSNPKAISGFIRATIKAIQESIRNPSEAIEALAAYQPSVSKQDELERLRLVLEENVLTFEARKDGIGGVRPARLARAIDQLGIAYQFRAKPAAADVFTDQFLPPAELRRAR